MNEALIVYATLTAWEFDLSVPLWFMQLDDDQAAGILTFLTYGSREGVENGFEALMLWIWSEFFDVLFTLFMWWLTAPLCMMFERCPYPRSYVKDCRMWMQIDTDLKRLWTCPFRWRHIRPRGMGSTLPKAYHLRLKVWGRQVKVTVRDPVFYLLDPGTWRSLLLKRRIPIDGGTDQQKESQLAIDSHLRLRVKINTRVCLNK